MIESTGNRFDVYGINGQWYIKDIDMGCLCPRGYMGLVRHPYKTRKQARKVINRMMGVLDD